MELCWGYSENDGPEKWHEFFPAIASYSRQSPIDLSDQTAVVDETLNGLKRSYNENSEFLASNNGHSFLVSSDKSKKPGFVSGGPLDDGDRYELKQFHLHWGKPNEGGSEHTLNAKSFSGEIHFVHWNRSKFETFEKALASSQKDALCVLGVFLEEDSLLEADCPEFREIASLTEATQSFGEQARFSQKLNLNKLFPDNCGYFVYDGSLTTPPCSECVKWVVFEEPVKISGDFLDGFRAMASGKDGQILSHNWRSTQPLNGRSVFKATHSYQNGSVARTHETDSE